MLKLGRGSAWLGCFPEIANRNVGKDTENATSDPVSSPFINDSRNTTAINFQNLSKGSLYYGEGVDEKMQKRKSGDEASSLKFPRTNAQSRKAEQESQTQHTDSEHNMATTTANNSRRRRLMKMMPIPIPSSNSREQEEDCLSQSTSASSKSRGSLASMFSLLSLEADIDNTQRTRIQHPRQHASRSLVEEEPISKSQPVSISSPSAQEDLESLGRPNVDTSGLVNSENSMEVFEAVVLFLESLLLSNLPFSSPAERESPPPLRLFLADLVRQIDARSKLRIKGNGVASGEDFFVGVSSLLCGAIFIERMLVKEAQENNGPLVRRPKSRQSAFNLIAVATCVAVKVLVDEHPGNRRLSQIAGFPDVKDFNRLEAHLCVALDFDFALSNELLQTAQARIISLAGLSTDLHDSLAVM